MPGRDYVACFGWQCTEDDDNDSTDIGYSKLDNSNDHVTLVNNSRPPEGVNGDDENDYFRPADSYQWNPADADQGQETEGRHDEHGSHTYSGVHVQGSKSKMNSKRRGFRAQFRHVIHSSWKWFKRGFLFVAPTITAGMTFNPATAYVVSANARQAAAYGVSKKQVYL